MFFLFLCDSMGSMKAISIKNLRKTYPGGVEALSGATLEIDEGDFFGLLGPNGAGKTTTVQILSHLIRKSAGAVSVCGIDLDEDPIGVKSQLGVVPQEFNFAYFEALEDILIKQAAYYGLSRKLAKERAGELLERLGLGSKIRTPAFRLSGGMKRRLMVARALVHQPKILILDEPTAGVDVEMRRSLWDFLQEINSQGVTIILTTHYLEEAEYLCRNVGLINHGKLVGTYSIAGLTEHLDGESYYLTCQRRAKLDGEFNASWEESGELSVDIEGGKTLGDLFAWAGKMGLEVLSIKPKVGRLESLFQKLTGGKI